MEEKRAKTKPMKEDPSRETQSTQPEDDSIEIIEVVGMEDQHKSATHEPSVTSDESTSSEPPDSIPYSRQQLYDMLLRKQAEFENARKRMEKEREESERRTWMAVLQRLLPIVDNLQRALSGTPAQSDDPFRQGVSLTVQQMLEILTREGLEEVRAVGERFDPHLHEAVETRIVKGFEEGVVLEELRKGYRFRGHLLRPALVRVSARGEGESPGEA